MKHFLKFAICILVASGAVALAQSPANPLKPSASPVAYVYVARPTHIDSFAAASNGVLTAIQAGTSAVSGSISNLSVDKEFLFGMNDETNYIDAYSIASNGAIAFSAQTPLSTKDFCPGGPLEVDYTGKFLYVLQFDCDDTNELNVETFNIESGGKLKWLGASALEGYLGLSSPEPAILGNHKFAYDAGCYADSDEDYPDPYFVTYSIESNGLMLTNSAHFQPPPAYSGDGIACPELIASDGSDHIVMTGQDFSYDKGEYDGPVYLATYTADSHGNLTTGSTAKNMATVSSELYEVSALSIDPTSQFLAVGDTGFELFHWEGGKQVTKFTGVELPGVSIQQFAWDTSHHLYVLSKVGDVYVYTVSSTGIKEASGSPYSIPESSSIVVLSK